MNGVRNYAGTGAKDFNEDNMPKIAYYAIMIFLYPIGRLADSVEFYGKWIEMQASWFGLN